MTDRERFLACILGQPVDRPPFYLFWGPWGSTWTRWRNEGMPAHLYGDWSALRRHFKTDVPPFNIPVNIGPCPRPPWKILSENDQEIVRIDDWGITRRDLKTTDSMPEWVAYPVKSRDDWQRIKREKLDPHHPDRLAGNWKQACAAAIDQGRTIQFGYYPDSGIFGSVRWLLGDEECLVAFYEDPDMVHDIMNHMTTVWLTVLEEVVKHVRVDHFHFWEDMAGRAGPLISPAMFTEFMTPCYRRVIEACQRHHIPVRSVDTDGFPDLLLDPMIAAGINLLLPFEVAAGCDVNLYRKKYPHLGMLGGIDKRQLAKDPAAIDAELARIRPAILAGRYIPETDHLIPPDISWSNFEHYAHAHRKMIHALAGG